MTIITDRRKPVQRAIRGKRILVTLEEYVTQGFTCFSPNAKTNCSYSLIVKKGQIL